MSIFKPGNVIRILDGPMELGGLPNNISNFVASILAPGSLRD